MEIEIGIEIGMNLKGLWKFEIGMISEMKRNGNRNRLKMNRKKMEIGTEIGIIPEGK